MKVFIIIWIQTSNCNPFFYYYWNQFHNSQKPIGKHEHSKNRDRHRDSVDFRFGRTLSAGGPCASSGQQDVGHEGIVTRGDVLCLRSFFTLSAGSHLDTLFPLESPPFTPINLSKFITKQRNSVQMFAYQSSRGIYEIDYELVI